jgi:hypothetical protein
MDGVRGLPPLSVGMKRGVAGVESEMAATAKRTGKRAKATGNDWVSDTFEKTENEKNSDHSTCNHCHTELSTLNSTRMAEHLCNIKVCKYLTTIEAKENKALKVVNALAAMRGPDSGGKQSKLTGAGRRGALDFVTSEGDYCS